MRRRSPHAAHGRHNLPLPLHQLACVCYTSGRCTVCRRWRAIARWAGFPKQVMHLVGGAR